MLPIRTVLHPSDFSEPSRFAFELACAVARDYGAQLIICHVMQPQVPQMGEGVAAPVLEGYEEEIGAKLLRIQPPASIPVLHLLETGQPVDEIVRVAREARVELIVMGTHGKLGRQRVLLGSVAERVMREAPCPVLTVKTPFVRETPREFYCLTSAEERRLPHFAKVALVD
jgi:nucleotide-binding universal stress UspA family protein